MKAAVSNLLDQGTEPPRVIDALLEAMSVVGRRFKEGEMFVPEVLMAAKAMHAGLKLVEPLLVGASTHRAGTVVLGTVKGDLHDIGKNLVAMMLESGGYKVINLGIDIPPQGFVVAVKEHQADVLAMSALLTTTMMAMPETIAALAQEGLRDKVKVIIGGAPVSRDFAKEIGADGYAPDAGSAVDLCKSLLNK